MKVKDLMQTEVVTLRADDALDIAGDIMNLGQIRHLPVVDRDGALVGIITQRDLLKASISSVLGLAHRAEREWLEKVSVRDAMTRTIITIDPEAPLRDAVTCMLEGKLGCLPAVRNGELVGLLTETDCLRSLRDLLEAQH
ncbi:MAG: CBS domain-containing protein [Candidatus Binatia bacterium]